MSTHGWVSGDPWFICDVCGFQYRRSETRVRWDNLRVCTKDYEPRHPQEFVAGRRDKVAVVGARPQPTDVFLDVGDVTADDL